MFAAVKLKQREKNVVLVASPLRSNINDQVEAMPKEEKLVFQPLHHLAAEP